MIKVLAADIGGTNIRASVVTEQGQIKQCVRSQIDLGDKNLSEDDLVERLAAFFFGILKNETSIKAIGMGFPGFFMGDTGLLVASPNLPNLHNVELAKRLSIELNLPVHLQNDALCAAVGEHTYGAGKGSTNLLHVTLGTGIGGGLILNNMPYTGENGMAMELGHLRVAYDNAARSCGCGGSGCVEAYASATAIATKYFEVSGIRVDAKQVYDRACKNERDAINVFESAGYYLGVAIAQSIKLLDIKTVTISGGLTGAWQILYPAIVSSLDTELIAPLKGKVKVLRSALDDNAGIFGAAAIAQKMV
ncbi:MAG: transcriptional regulator [Gammaproteobacteria bacterium]|nr:MAG: transcriptional regulator [Gammaproteobacteria bacterium]